MAASIDQIVPIGHADAALPGRRSARSLRSVALVTLTCSVLCLALYFYLGFPSTSVVAAWSATFATAVALIAILLFAKRDHRFSIRSMLVAMGTVSLVLGALSQSIVISQRQREAMGAIELLGGKCANAHGMKPQFVWAPTVLLDLGMTTVCHVSLANTAATDSDLSHLYSFRHLISLDISNCPITDKGLEHLQSHVRLERLIIDGTDVTVEGVDDLFRSQNRPLADALAALGVKFKARPDGTVTSIATENWKIVRPVLLRPELAVLNSLDLSQSGITDDDLAQLSHLSQLRELNVMGTKVSDAGLRHLKSLKSLQRLQVRDTAISYAGVKHLLVNLQRRPVAQAMTAYGWSTKLRYDFSHTLYCDRNSVKDVDLREIGEMESLRVLLLDSELVTDAELKHLAKLRQLERLYLRRTQVTHRGLAELTNLRRLALLDLMGSRNITAEALPLIAGYDKLTSLNLGFTGIESDGLLLLSRMSGLRELDLSGEIGSEEDVASLRRALPQTRILPE